MSDNQQARMVDEELHQSEATEEKVSLSDRFGLWLSFYPVKQEAYLDMATHWVMTLAMAFDAQDQSWASDLEEYRAAALHWALARGVRSGRTAQHFARHCVNSSPVALKTKTINQGIRYGSKNDLSAAFALLYAIGRTIGISAVG